MRINLCRWAIWPYIASRRLSFDTYCTLCSRPGQPGIDICSACESQFKSRLRTGYNGVKTILCAGCGVECTVLGIVRRHLDTIKPPVEPPCLSGSLVKDDETELRGFSDFCVDCSLLQGRFPSRIVAPYRYAYPLDKLVQRLKYGKDRQLARVLGTLLAFSIEKDPAIPLPGLLIPMPLHSTRLHERGFNQANDIARWCGQYLGIEVSSDHASRMVDTGSLAGLSRAERQHRILGAFRASDRLIGKHVAIVDDVLTTGASARELAREIYDSGAASVELWVLARTSRLRAGR